ncbi:MAG: hypothetical protein OCC49_03550 [Fibrobacterales bacterium]
MRIFPQLNGISKIRQVLFLIVIVITICQLFARKLEESASDTAYYLNGVSWALFGMLLIGLIVAKKSEKKQE